MAEKKGNGQQGMDLIAMLYTEVTGMGAEIDRHYEEQKRHHEEMTSHVRRMAEMILAIADKLRDHEQRLAAVEAKVG